MPTRGLVIILLYKIVGISSQSPKVMMILLTMNGFLDSCCTKHLCSRKNYFDLLFEKLTIKLNMGDISIGKVMYVTMVKIKIFD